MAQTSRDRVSRIDKEYFKRPDRLTRAKRWLAGILVTISTVWLVAEVASALSGRPDSRIAYLYSRGELANPHAMWDRDCSVCHEAFSPISDQAGWLTAHVGSDSNLRCTACHAGPIHHPRMLETEADGRCASCHQDHQGRNHPLTQMVDSACTSCHTDLPAHTNDSVEPIGRTFAARITSFNRDHPEFHAVETKRDPGRLHFNHALHLAKGLPKTNAQGEPWFTYRHIDARDRDRYLRLAALTEEGGDSQFPAGQAIDPAAFVQLDCRACHVLDNGDMGLSAAEQARWDVPATPEQRAYFSPIQFEQHCRACHSLAIHAPPTLSSPDGTELVQSPRLDWQIELPHGLEPGEVRQLLEHHWSWRDFDPNSPLTPPSRPFPGKRSAVPDSAEETAGARRDAEVARLMRLLFQAGGDPPTAPSKPESATDHTPTRQASLGGQQGCTVCHQVRVEATSDLADPPAGRSVENLPTYHLLPTNVPQVWMPHGWFDHSAHRGVRCEACHSGTRESTSAADVLLPGIENCQQCHGPTRREAGRQLGGASTRCTECHRYHDREKPLAGIGARARDALDPREIDAYLRGDPPVLTSPSPTHRNP